MAKIQYVVEKRWAKSTRELLYKVIEIVDEYTEQGYRMTLRQLYYQLVSRDIIPNQQREYAKLSRILTEARMAGLVDWDFIEDRIRIPKFPNQFDSVDDAMEQNKNCVILYFGDHDPSGEDMVRDIQDRLSTFGCEVEVRKVALTMEQVEEYHPPPNPAKLSDPRAEGYIAEHGDESWELDALPPDVLISLVRENLDEFLDKEKYDSVVEQEDSDKTKMKRFGSKNKGDD